MLYFASDYQEGAHPAVMARLSETNGDRTPGYGTDEYCALAREKIRAACACPDAAVHFLVGGTQANATVIDALLRGYEGVIAADTGHIAAHEAGAIEAGGHKVLTLPHENGKLTAPAVRAYCRTFFSDENHAHMVRPGMVYLSQPTEYGTVYSLSELGALRAVCDEYSLRLYIDGARLACALAAAGCDAGLSDLARTADAFTIGGTKCGALFGEAVVIPDPALLPHFFTTVKQHGALLAKGRALGVQFDALMTDGLYTAIGAAAVAAAERLRGLFRAAGWELIMENPTNQVFVVLENSVLRRLSEEVVYSFWERFDEERSVVRFCGSWSTREEELAALEALVGRLTAGR